MNLKEVNDDYITSLTLWREARGIRPEPVRAQAYAGIYDVIRTRLADGRPRKSPEKSAAGVCLEPWQFSSFNLGEVNSTKFPLPSSAADWEAFTVAWEIIQDLKPQPVRLRASHYHTYPEGHKLWPKWAVPSAQVAKIGPVYFYLTV